MELSVSPGYKEEVIIEAMMYKNTNKQDKSYVKRYFILDLINATFSCYYDISKTKLCFQYKFHVWLNINYRK